MSFKDKVRTFREEMHRDIRASYKSEDTEEWFDRVFTKPMAYFWTRLFIHLKWTPNMVTILSMFIGVGGGVLFYPEKFHLNLIGVLLVIWANILDSTDGQMARLTGQKSALGRVLDGMSSTLWYIAMYIAVCCRLQDDPIPFTNGMTWGWIIWAVAIVCGLLGHAQQCTLADRYRNIHLFFLRNKHGSELERSEDVTKKRLSLPEKGETFQKLYLFIYGIFTTVQEKSTPTFQKVLSGYLDADEATREGIRQDYLTGSRKYIQLTNILTFNARAYLFFACVLLNVPAVYFLLEFIGFGALKMYTQNRYERLAKDILVKYCLPGHDAKFNWSAFWHKVFFVVGVIGVAAMLLSTDLSQVDWDGTVLRLMPVWLPLLLVVWLVIYAIQAVSWRIIMGKQGKAATPGVLLRVTISGFALNHVTPCGLVGGEFYRAMEIKPRVGTSCAVASTLAFTIMNTFAHVMFWFTGAVMYLLIGCPGSPAVTVCCAVLAVVCGVGLVLFLRNCKRGLVLSTMRLLSKLPVVGSRVAAHTEKKQARFEEIDRSMEDFYGRHKDFWLTVLLEYAARLLEAVEFLVIFAVLGLDVPYTHCAIALSVGSLVGNLMFFIPMQVGTREMGLAMALSWVGMASHISLTAALMARIREIIYTALGVLMMLIRNGELPTQVKPDMLETAEKPAAEEVSV